MQLKKEVEAEHVLEAHRLMQVAMQQAATDPRTGAIDMDLLTTGVSASARREREQLAAALVELIRERVPSPGGGMPLAAVAVAIEQQSGRHVSVAEISAAVQHANDVESMRIDGDRLVRTAAA